MVPYFRSGMSKLALRIKYNIPTNSIVFLMVGSLKPLKGSKYVLNEFIKLDRDWIEQKNIRVLFVGNGADYIDMIDLTKSSRIADFIHFITFIRNEQISEVYELSDYFIMASDYEGTSKAMLEAMEKKLPIFATNVNGINNVLKHSFSAVLFQKNSGELANLIKTWLAKSDELSEFAEEAFKIYDRQYHFNLTVEHLKSIYGL
jgi:glycosyltransferase involved in cell wall biosynthesis